LVNDQPNSFFKLRPSNQEDFLYSWKKIKR